MTYIIIGRVYVLRFVCVHRSLQIIALDNTFTIDRTLQAEVFAITRALPSYGPHTKRLEKEGSIVKRSFKVSLWDFYRLSVIILGFVLLFS